MAEFAEVCRQWKRMCDSVQCNGDCVIGKNKNVNAIYCETWGFAHHAEAEKLIMDWAAAHPEPVYPTWKEWQDEKFPDAVFGIRPCQFAKTKCRVCDGRCRNQPIPADIAEKLGINPKEEHK